MAYRSAKKPLTQMCRDVPAACRRPVGAHPWIRHRCRAYRRGAWWTGVVLGALTAAASVFAGLLGPVAIAVCAVIFSLPAWAAWWWLAHNG